MPPHGFEHRKPGRRLAGKYLLLALGLVLFVLGSLGPTALAQVADDSDQATREPEDPDSRDSGLSDEDEARLNDRLEEEEAERQRRRSDPDERAKRDSSRTAYTDDALSANDATALARDRFEGSIVDPIWDQPLAEPGGEVKRFLSDHAALLEGSDGNPQVVESPDVPLRDPQGDPIDLDLAESSASFHPEDTAGSVRLPKDITDGVSFPKANLSVEPVEADSQDPEGREVGQSVAWPKVAPDTDLFGVPTPGGVQLLGQLRSAGSPEDIELKVNLPDGATLEEVGNGEEGAQVVKDGRGIADISFPLATDSDGEEVPSSLSVKDGDRLVLHVDHSGGDWRYPLLLDPVMTAYDSWFSGTDRTNPEDQTTGWYHESNASSRFTFRTAQDFSTCYRKDGTSAVNPDCRGLYVFSDSNQDYNDGDEGHWTWQTPGASSYLTKVEFLNTFFSRRGESSPDAQIQMGMRAPGSKWVGLEDYGYAQSNETRTVTPGENVTNPDSQHAFWARLALRFTSSGHRDERAQAFLGGARLYVTDPEKPTAPTLSHQGLPRWVSDTTPTTTATSTDPGLGVKSFAFHPPSGTDQTVESKNPACTGTKQSPCPNPGSGAYSYSTTGLPEGVNTFSVKAADPLGAEDPVNHVSAPTEWPVRVDRTAPNIATVTGSALAGWRGTGNHILHVEATDQDPSGPRAGVREMRLRVNGATDSAGQPSYLRTQAAPTANCDSCPMSYDFSIAGSDLREGLNDVVVVVIDNAGNVARQTVQVKHDRSPSVVTTSGPMDANQGKWVSLGQPATTSLIVNAKDEDASGPRAGVSEIRTRINGATDSQGQPLYKHQVPNSTCSGDSCSQTAGPLLFDDSDFPEGKNTVRVEAPDRATPTNVGAKDLEVKVDRTSPTLTLSGSLKDNEAKPDPADLTHTRVLPSGSHDLHIDARDPDPGRGRSCVAFAELTVDGARKRRIDAPNQPDACSIVDDFTFNTADYTPGAHVISVFGTDQAGNPFHQSFTVIIGSELFEPGSQYGLEQFFQFETTETGAKTQAHVNVATGNMVWHSTPIVNPGRGLSSVVNVTYNSQGPVGDELIGYGEAGKGFSLGASGLTRVNEPLDLKFEALLGVIDLTDLDGTRHRFVDPDRDGAYTAPPGVNLNLRRFSTTKKDKTWAVTRPDGVTHFFDERGFQTWTEDRNANKLRFDYERVLPTGAPCPLPPPPGPVPDVLCKQRLTRLVDPAGVDGAQGRSLDFAYYDEAVQFDPANPSIPQVQAGSLGRVKSITDHGGRELSFDYDQLGYLTRMTQATGTDEERAFKFRYEDLGNPPDPNAPSVPLVDRDLTSVTDPNGTAAEDAQGSTLDLQGGPQKTEFNYELDPLDALPTSPAFFGKRVETKTDRRPQSGSASCQGLNPPEDCHTDRFSYRQFGGVPPVLTADQPNETTMKNARGHDTVYRTDDRGRLRERTDARGTKTDLAWSTDNNVTKLTQAAGSPDEVVTDMTYDHDGADGNGLLASSTVAPGTDDERRTELEYQFSQGVDALQSEQGLDASKEFVADLTSITKPEGFADGKDPDDYTTTFEPDARGNQTARTDPGDNRAETDFDGRGQVTAERDELGQETTYPSYDPNGMPTEKVDPRGKRWRYRYDAVGNLLTATDPRGPADPQAGDAFTTTLTYDALDQLVHEQKPKDSASGDFIERTMTYDDNGNQTAKVDGNNQTWNTSFTATDKPAETQTPAAKHFGEGDDPAPEVTENRYDEEENLLEEIRPEGVRTERQDDYSTRFSYDEVGEKVAETRRSRDSQADGSPKNEDLVTSWAYDRRGNVTGVADPRHNAAGGEPADNASDENTQRLSYGYDRSDNRTSETEDPGGEALRTETAYDLDDNKLSETDPRGTAEGASRSKFTNRWEYDGRDLTTAEIAPLPDGGEARTEHTYRDDGMLASTTTPNGTASALDGDFETTYDYFETGELKSRTLPWAQYQYGLAQGSDGAVTNPLKVSYAINEVGNPTTITDARGNDFDNTFYDTGDLRTTERPSWWGYAREGQDSSASDGSDSADGAQKADAGDEASAPAAEASAAGGLTEAASPDQSAPDAGGASPMGSGSNDPGGADGTAEASTAGPAPEISERGPSPSSGQADQLPSSEGDGDFGEVKGQPIPGVMPKAGHTELDYDGEMRLSQVTSDPDGLSSIHTEITHDSLGRVSETSKPFKGDARIVDRYAYDRNGNVRQRLDGENDPTTTSYDQFDRPVEEARPGSKHKVGPDEAIPDEVTLTRYDENGNTTDTQTPRGSEAAERDDAEPFTTYTEHRGYDALDRLESMTNPAGEETTYEHDGAGNVSLERSPKGNAGSSPDDSYATRSEYDGRDLLVKETDGHGEYTEHSYDGDGNEVKLDAPGAARGPGLSPERRVTEHTYDGRDLPWAETTESLEGPRTQVTEFDPNGNLRREVKPSGVDASKRATESDPGGPITTPETDATKQATVNEYDADNLLTVRHLPWGENDDQDRRHFRQDFHRDRRGWLTDLESIHEWAENSDGSVWNLPGAMTHYEHYDSGWISSSTDPTLEGQSYDQTLTYDYDRRGMQTLWRSDNDREMRREYFPSGQLRTREAEGDNAQGQRITRTYEYAWSANRSLTETKDQEKDRLTHLYQDAAERETVVDEDWPAQGELPSGRDTATDYDRDGNVSRRRTDGVATVSAEGEVTDYSGGKSTTYAYDSLDRETDMSVEQGSQTRATYSTYHPSGELRSRTNPDQVAESTYFGPDGDIAKMMRAKGSGSPVKDQGYGYDVNGNREADERGSYRYNARDQLTSWSKPGQTDPEMTYELNGSGGVEVKREAGQPEEDSTFDGDRLASTRQGTTTRSYDYDPYGNMTKEWSQADGQSKVAENNYGYDAFERLSSGGPGESSAAEYVYDGLDRRDYRSEGGSRLDSGYVGTSEALSREEDPGKTQTYDYDSSGDSQGQATTEGGSTTYRPFGKDANGSVEGLEGSDGAVAPGARYDYDPYGDAGEPSDQAAAANPIRFEGFRYDSGIKTYDMQARQYRPDVGRFLTQDRFEASSGDFSLQSDPLTQNRYAFAGGNPVSRVEWDGHRHRTGRLGSNGCGPYGPGWRVYIGTRLILDRLPGIYNFRRFCNQHDRNYGVFHARRRGLSQRDSRYRTRLHYDKILGRQLTGHCLRRHGRRNPLRYTCLGYAGAFYGAIRRFSGYAYINGQRQGLRRAKRGHSRRYYPQ